jgi:hypothetical protein
MIIRGGGAIGVAGLAGAAACICAVLFCGGICVAGGVPTGTAGVVARGGVAIPAGTVLGSDEAAAGVDALGGVTDTFGGITTTDGGR